MAAINMAGWPKNHHIIPAINIPPKVYYFAISESYCEVSTPESHRWICTTAHKSVSNTTQQETACHTVGCCWDPEGVTKCYSKGRNIALYGHSRELDLPNMAIVEFS